MTETVRCPDCNAELTLPASLAQEARCPRCERVFEPSTRSSTAVTAEKRSTILRHSLQENEQIEPKALHLVIPPPGGDWCGIAASVMIAVNTAALALPACLLAVDNLQWNLAPEVWIEDPFQIERFSFLKEWFFWVWVTAIPAYLGFSAWYYVACRNAHPIMPGRLLGPEFAVAFLFIPLVNGIALYVNLQEIFRASDPSTIWNSDAKDAASGSRLVRFWALSLVFAPLILCVSACLLLDYSGLAEFLAVFAILSVAAAGVFLIAIIRSIMLRQRRLYELVIDRLQQGNMEGI
jgi:phage FluMu protein Com